MPMIFRCFEDLKMYRDPFKIALYLKPVALKRFLYTDGK